MSKNIGILLNSDTGDIDVLESNTINIGDVTLQNQAVILQAFKGEFKENPTLGVGISNMVCDNEITGWQREILLQLEADGMTVKDVEINLLTNKLSIDANYSKK